MNVTMSRKENWLDTNMNGFFCTSFLMENALKLYTLYLSVYWSFKLVQFFDVPFVFLGFTFKTIELVIHDG